MRKFPVKTKNALSKLPKDSRDFNLGAVFPQISLSELPSDDFIIAEPILIKDQKDSDLCSAYAVTAVSEDQEGEELLPEYQFFQTKQISGAPDEWGANLRDACKSAVKFGSLPLKNGVTEFSALKGISRTKLLKSETWSDLARQIALFHKKETYFNVDGKYDTFDNIRTRLWQHRDKKCSIVTGVLWRNEWIDAPRGIIPVTYGADGFGHAFKIFGQKVIDGEVYLVAQLSQGKNVGDNGLFYFNREVTNKEIGEYGIYMFTDMSREDAENIIKNKGNSLFIQLWSFLANLFSKFL